MPSHEAQDLSEGHSTLHLDSYRELGKNL